MKLQCKAPDTHFLTAEDFAPGSTSSLCWLGGAGFMLNINGKIILIDPVLTTKNPGGLKSEPYPDLKQPAPGVCETGLPMLVNYPIGARDIPKVDAVLYTHTDSDHLGPVTAKILIEKNPLFLGTPLVIKKLISMGAGEERCVTGIRGDIFTFEDISIEFTPADHSWPGSGFGADDCCGYLIKTPDSGALGARTVWFTGDTRLMPEHFKIKDADIFPLDVSRDAYHLGIENAAKLADHLENARLIPYHYGTYNAPKHTAFNGDPDEIFPLIKNAAERIHLLAPGEMITM